MIDICGTCHKNFVECECAKEGRGAKFDQGKDRWDLLPFAEVKEIVQVFTLGAKKYADNILAKCSGGKKKIYSCNPSASYRLDTRGKTR